MEATDHMKISNIPNKQLKNVSRKSSMVELSLRGETISFKWWNRFQCYIKPSLFPITSDMQGALLLKWVLYPPPPPSHSEDLNRAVLYNPIKYAKVCKYMATGLRIWISFFCLVLILIQIILFLTCLFY
jgi:hypothetical protein